MTQAIYNSTLFIVAAQHGQSPTNPVKTKKPDHFADLVVAPPDANTDPAAAVTAAAANCASGPRGFVMDDDIALISKNHGRGRIRNPLKDTRTPGTIVQPVYGTIYTGSSKKNAEHDGFSFGDTNVGLIGSNPGFIARVDKTPVATSQVAPTILNVLGIDAEELDAVRIEGTGSLAFLED